MFVGAQSLERWWGSGSDGVWFKKLGGCLFTDCRLERGLEKARKRPAAAETNYRPSLRKAWLWRKGGVTSVAESSPGVIFIFSVSIQVLGGAFSSLLKRVCKIVCMKW